jgi:hypothetical protein
MDEQSKGKRGPREIPPDMIFDGERVTATTVESSAVIHLKGHEVSGSDVGHLLAIRGGLEFIIGTYGVISADSASNTWTLDRKCTVAAGTAMTGKVVARQRREYKPVVEYYDAAIPDNPGRGEARDMVLAALNVVEPDILRSLAETCCQSALLEPEIVGDHDWHGPLDVLLWVHVETAGDIERSAGWIILGNLKPLRDGLTRWAKGGSRKRWNLCSKDGVSPLDWIADAAVQTLVFWQMRGKLPKVLRWENLHFYCYRALDTDESIEMFNMERSFDAGSGYLRIAPESGVEPVPFSDRVQRAAKQQYKSSGQKLGLIPMPRVSARYFEWYALQTFLGFKLKEIRERELRMGGDGIGDPSNPDDLSAIAHGIATVARLVEFRR